MRRDRKGKFTAFLHTRWNRLSWIGRLVFLAAVMAGFALSGALLGGAQGSIRGAFLGILTLAALSAVMWWKEPGKTLVSQLVFFPLALVGADRQLPIVAPLAPAPTITVTPLFFWIIIASVSVHTVNVSRQWLRALAVVLTASFGGWLLGEFWGPWGVASGYAISAVLLYVLTWGWAPIMLKRRKLRVRKSLRSVPNLPQRDVSIEKLQSSLGEEWALFSNIRVDSKDRMTVFPLVAVGPYGVFPVAKHKHKGVLREDSKGLTIGGELAGDELADYAFECERLARLLSIPMRETHPILIVEGAAIKGGRARVSIDDGDVQVFTVTLVKEPALESELLRNDIRKLGVRSKKRSIKRLTGLSGGPAVTTGLADNIAPESPTEPQTIVL